MYIVLIFLAILDQIYLYLLCFFSLVILHETITAILVVFKFWSYLALILFLHLQPFTKKNNEPNYLSHKPTTNFRCLIPKEECINPHSCNVFTQCSLVILSYNNVAWLFFFAILKFMKSSCKAGLVLMIYEYCYWS